MCFDSSFSKPRLFVCAAHLMAQDEIQVAEHPVLGLRRVAVLVILRFVSVALGALREALLRKDTGDAELRPSCSVPVL